MPKFKQIFNACCEETAHTITNFPVSHGKFAALKIWVETNPSFGQRIMRTQSEQFDENNFNRETIVWKPASPLRPGHPNSGYHSLVILTANDDQASPYCGHPKPIFINLETISEKHLLSLVDKDWPYTFVFTPWQKHNIAYWMVKRKLGHIFTTWKDDSVLDKRLISLMEKLPNQWRQKAL